MNKGNLDKRTANNLFKDYTNLLGLYTVQEDINRNF